MQSNRPLLPYHQSSSIKALSKTNAFAMKIVSEELDFETSLMAFLTIFRYIICGYIFFACPGRPVNQKRVKFGTKLLYVSNNICVYKLLGPVGVRAHSGVSS